MARLAGLELKERWGELATRAVHRQDRRHVSVYAPMNEHCPRRVRPGRAGHPRPRGDIDKLAALTAEAKGEGAQLVVFPETFIPAYP